MGDYNRKGEGLVGVGKREGLVGVGEGGGISRRG